MLVGRLQNIGRKFHNFIGTPGALMKKDAVSRNGDFWALKGVNIDIGQGEIIGLIGRNGAGKSTLLNIIAGILPPSEGDISINGNISAILKLGAGFQDEFSGKENIYLNAALLGIKRQEIERKFADIIGFSELGNFINAPLGSYSAGMKMRLGFSIVIYKDFDILLTDEIITVGDMSFQKKCFEKMIDFKRQGKSMIIATQDMSLVQRFCDRVFLLEDGRVFYSGNPAEAIENYQLVLSRKQVLSDQYCGDGAAGQEGI
jgi:ABC-type polysaccharide/polyol phosphate transport system ATPase subunit